MSNTPSTAITSTDLKEILAQQQTSTLDIVQRILEESRKPAPPTQREVDQLAVQQEERAAMSQSVRDAAANKRAMQMACTHTHPNGATHCVFVRDENPASPGYILCQKQQCKIRPVGGPVIDKSAIYDTRLFNELFQACNQVADIIG